MYTDPMPKEIFQAGIKSAGVENARLIYKGLKTFADESKAAGEAILLDSTLALSEQGRVFFREAARREAYTELMDMIAEVMKGDGK